MKTWGLELTAGWKSLAESKIQRGILQGDALSRLLYIIAMMPLNHILRKCTAGYKLPLVRYSEPFLKWIRKELSKWTKEQKKKQKN